MNPFKNSLKTRIHFLGFILAIFMLFTLYLAIQGVVFYVKRDQAHNAIEIYLKIQNKDTNLKKYLQEKNIVKINEEEALSVRNRGVNIVKDFLIRTVSDKSGFYLYWYNYHSYSFLHLKNRDYYFKEQKSYLWKMVPLISVLFILFFIALYGIYYYLKISLRPLIRLHKNILNFSNAKDIAIKYESNNDEIGELANAFYKAMDNNKKLKDSRDIYIRTIMHEIKTPLTKARFLTHFLKDDIEEKSKFNQLFINMQDELAKLSEFEKINSNLFHIQIEPININTLIDETLEKLLIDKISVEINQFNLNKDLDPLMFSVVLKNLIDNAIKYSKNKTCQIHLSQNKILIQNLSLMHKAIHFDSLIEPFRQEDETVHGMGLGLYLANEIILKHGFSLKYKFQDDFHIFEILFK